MEHTIRDITNSFQSFDFGSPKCMYILLFRIYRIDSNVSSASPTKYQFPSLLDIDTEKENEHCHSSFDYCPVGMF